MSREATSPVGIGCQRRLTYLVTVSSPRPNSLWALAISLTMGTEPLAVPGWPGSSARRRLKRRLRRRLRRRRGMVAWYGRLDLLQVVDAATARK